MNDDSMPNLFAALSYQERKLLYLGLLNLVKSNSGEGFANGDQGHPAYAIGCSGKFDYEAWGDSPDHNKLFKMMHTLSVSLSEAEIDSSSEISDYVFCWADFCQISNAAHKKSRG